MLDKNENNEEAKILLHKEQLGITKKLVQTGQVKMHVEQFTEEKTITVPVNRKELVIEKIIFNEDNCDNSDTHTEVIRIPVSEERVNISKQTVTLNDINIYKHKFQEIENISENLKEEKVHVETVGTPKITYVNI
jgi:uncharacterized protein (TIGR02271 family)